MTILIDRAFLRANPLPAPEKEGSKQHRGRVLIVAGSVQMPGPALLAANGALRAGAGILQIATCRSVAVPIGIAMPEALVVGAGETDEGGLDPTAIDQIVDLARESDAVCIGPGMVDESAVQALTMKLLEAAPKSKFVLDALALQTFDAADIGQHEDRIVVTPHAGEMARLLRCEREKVERDPLAAAMNAVDRTNGVVVMKGAQTYIAAEGSGPWVCKEGTIGLATSGSGDVLAGILSGLLARGAASTLAAIWAVYLHAAAGQRLTARHGTFGLLAREIPGEVPALMDEVIR